MTQLKFDRVNSFTLSTVQPMCVSILLNDVPSRLTSFKLVAHSMNNNGNRNGFLSSNSGITDETITGLTRRGGQSFNHANVTVDQYNTSRYRSQLHPNTLSTPMYHDQRQRQYLYQDDNNSIHSILRYKQISPYSSFPSSPSSCPGSLPTPFESYRIYVPKMTENLKNSGVLNCGFDVYVDGFDGPYRLS
ncbi:unnamed protein product [Ambrosiozyma monospora]|uniref:Unnamed protein product n=1 Tax=Ambrosiozyma monospora TaxID=43982 RepID=A0A9W6WM62_AMBMO|nr:unnamed protein product [Ambrosiozyma monospora]